MPRILEVDPQAIDASAVSEAARVLRFGGLVAIPTETVYGLAARALDPRAVERIFQVKGRPPHHPVIAHVLDEDQARALAASWPPTAARLARAFWPGPLTLVVDRAAHVPGILSGGADSVGLRAPSHPVAHAIIAALGEPVAAPSANRFQRVSPTTASHVVKQLGDAVDLVVDSGPCESGIESTVVDVRGDVARVLRPGALSVAALRAVLGSLEARGEAAASDERRPSPGMDRRHYAPRAALQIEAGTREALRAAREHAAAGRSVALVVHEEVDPGDPAVLVRRLPSHPTSYAQLLYGTLHDLDDAGVAAIVVQAVPGGDDWWAVADRLRRASAIG